MNEAIIQLIKDEFLKAIGFIGEIYSENQIFGILEHLNFIMDFISIQYNDVIEIETLKLTDILSTKFDNINNERIYTITELISEVKIGTRNHTINYVLDGE